MNSNSAQLKERSHIEDATENGVALEEPKLHTNLNRLNFDKLLESKLNPPGVEVTLTKREREILDFVLAGNTNKEIAQKLFRTERTIEYHRNRMMRKLGTHNPIELVKRAIAMGIV